MNHNNILVTYVSSESFLTFKGNSTVTFYENHAKSDGGAFYIDYSTVTFEESSVVKFYNNFADNYGGALYVGDHSTLTFEGTLL